MLGKVFKIVTDFLKKPLPRCHTNRTNSCSPQYYDDTFPTAKEKKAFERNLFNKTHRVNGEIIMLDGLTCVYKSSVDLFFYVMGSANENGVTINKYSE